MVMCTAVVTWNSRSVMSLAMSFTDDDGATTVDSTYSVKDGVTVAKSDSELQATHNQSCQVKPLYDRDSTLCFKKRAPFLFLL